jgi:hypothetical protein
VISALFIEQISQDGDIPKNIPELFSLPNHIVYTIFNRSNACVRVCACVLHVLSCVCVSALLVSKNSGIFGQYQKFWNFQTEVFVLC